MKTVLIHLSDAHFKSATNNLDNKGETIANAVQVATALADNCFIVFTGDIAFSGLPEEYDKAYVFLTSISKKLRTNNSKLTVKFVLVPGNHDCDFRSATGVRSLSLNNPESLLDSLSPKDTSIVNVITSVQNNFFDFLAKIEAYENSSSLVTKESDYNRLCYTRDFEFGDIRFRFNCFNTAWVSKLKEEQGHLIFPDFIQPSQDNYNLNISLFHHPYNWLETTNASLFKKQIEPFSNFILTGHEHESNQYSKSGVFSGNQNLYIEAPVLQNGENSDSGFNIIELDSNENKYRIREYSFSLVDEIYHEVNKSDWRNLEIGETAKVNNFNFSEDFSTQLNDAGVYLKHPSQNQVTLEDIFLCPDLEIISLQKKDSLSKHTYFVESEQVLDFLSKNNRIIITGADTCGRTSLAKVLCRHLKEKNLTPLIIQGNLLTNVFEDEFIKTIRRAITEQYSVSSVDLYFQKDLDQKVLIIDDFHRSNKINRAGKQAVLDLASKHFGRIIVFADDLFRFEEITQYAETDNFLLELTQAEIKPFGQRLRRKLISKWFKFGRDFTEDDLQIDRRVEETADVVTTLLGRKMVPSYPIFVLSMLQILEAGKDLNTAPTNFGYFYEVFILASLSDNRPPSVPLDVLTTFIPLFAYKLFSSKKRYLEESEFESVLSEYHKNHAFSLKFDQAVKILVSSKIIYLDSYGRFRFKYKMGYYYFVAKYFSNNVNKANKKEEIRTHLIRLANNLYVEDYANIIIFFVYLTQDETTINHILNNAKGLYEEHKPCNLTTDIEFINKFKITSPVLQLENNDPKANKEEYLRNIDTHERESDVEDIDEDYEIERELNDVLRLNVSLKTLQIMGQILRNFPGLLEREQKLELAHQSYELGLRTLQMMFSIIEKFLPELRGHLTTYVKDKFEITDDEKSTHLVDNIFFMLMVVMVFGMVKKISNAVGSEHLKDTYEEILTIDNSIPIKLIDTYIRINYFRPFPEEKLKELDDMVKNNRLCFTIEQKMIYDHFYFHKEGYKLRQKICDKYGIKLSDEKVIGSRDKM